MRFLLALTAAFSSLIPQAARAEVQTIMVLPFTGEGIRDDVLSGLQAIFMEEARKLPGITIPELTARALMMSNECAGDPQCLGKGLSRLGATAFLFTDVSKPERGGFQLRQSLHEAPSGTLVRDSVEVLRGKGSQLENLAFRAAAKVLSPDQLKGGLQVEVNIPGATVFVDGERIGKSPLPGPHGGLTEGKHQVKVTKDGYGAFEQPVEITFSEVTSVDVRLTRDAQKEFKPSPVSPSRPPPILPAIIGGVGAGITAVVTGLFLLAGVSLFGATGYLAETITTDAKNGTLFFPEDEPLIRLWQASLGGMVGAFIVAGVVLVVGVIGTGVATAGGLAFHFTRPLPEAEKEVFVEQRPRIKERSRVTTSDEEEQPAEAPPPPPKPKKKKPQPEPDEENLPEGE